MGVAGWSLADDVLVIEWGKAGHDEFEAAFTATHQFLKDMGAKLAPTKSTGFSTCSDTRHKLARKVWQEVQATI